MSRRTQVTRPCSRKRFAYGAFTRSGRPSQVRSATLAVSHCTGQAPAASLQPRAPEGTRFGLLPVRSPLLGESRLISTPAGTQMVHSPAYTACALCIGAHANVIRTFGLPHSEIRGSSGIGPFPRLIAANHVLLRLAAPRHPPWTLIHLTISFFQSLRSYHVKNQKFNWRQGDSNP